MLPDLNAIPLSLDLGSYRSEILNWGYIGPVYWRNYLHTHSCFEVCYASAGRGLFRIHTHDHLVQVGDLFVARPGEPHEIVSSSEDPLGIHFWAYTLHPRPDRPSPPADTDALLSAFRASGPWLCNQSQDVATTIHLLEAEISRRRPGYVDAIRALTTKLLLDTARALVTVDLPVTIHLTPRRTAAEQTAGQIVRYLQDNFTRPLTVRDVAAQVHLSERHTNRLFRTVTGVSILEYLTTLRVEAASQLLLERRLTVKEVARAVGYADVHYFTTLFHRRTGLPPATFRRRDGTRLVPIP